MSVLICPVCREELNKAENKKKKKNGHSFDLAREGYVNLLLGSKSGDKKGDSKESARARHAFLAKGYYSFLKEYLCSRMQGTVLDICCGDGYYDDYDGELYGFDISKEMVRLASKSNKGGFYFAANLANIPIKNAGLNTKSFKSTNAAAATTGVDNKNEYFATDSLFKPIPLPTVIVIPDLDTPGNAAAKL